MIKPITLTHPTKPAIQVTIISPTTDGEIRLKLARGIGALRADGYDVSPIKGHGTVYILETA